MATKDWVVAGLVLLAVVQIAVLGAVRGDATEGAAKWLAPGGQVADIEVLDRTGAPRSLVTGQPTLVLVFHSECGHCRRVAPVWRAWLEAHEERVAVVGVSSELHSSAQAYVIEHGWDVTVRTVPEASLGSREHALTSRTPWLFALDAAGFVVAEGHGSLIEEIGGLLLDELEASKLDR